ncbi:hypothetical protein AAF712_005087 [Marasmius tenuissimus]|uniref:Uncharacterized protein n=1 Tax=Marasmius tenuissimus TaxID=585030 RepID=A0ABR3A2P5_9AGAR
MALHMDPRIQHLATVAATYQDLQLYEEALEVANRVLAIAPETHSARFTRGLAEESTGLFREALQDLTGVHSVGAFALSITQSHINHIRALRPHIVLAVNQVDESTLPAHAKLFELENDDFFHLGNGTACRYYNHNGCVPPDQNPCEYQRAQDSKSVRDESGRNVCLRYLVDECKYGRTCIYSPFETVSAAQWMAQSPPFFEGGT